MNKYYELIATDSDGNIEVQFGSFIKSEVVFEKEAEKETIKSLGYKNIKIRTIETNELPDSDVYGDELYKKALCEALKNEDITIAVGDLCEDYFDIEESRDLGEIIEACEATDQPAIHFFNKGEEVGRILVICGYGDSSILDHTINDFAEMIVNKVSA